MVEILSKQNKKEWLDKAEDFADLVVRRSRRVLPHVARLCLMATFIEDGFRLLTQWYDQVEFISNVWNAPAVLGGLFIILNICLQFGGSTMVMLRYCVKIGCGALMATVLLQTVGYGIWSRVFFIRNLSLAGSLVLLLAENNEQNKSLLAGLPSAGESSSSPRQFLLLGGRLLVILMFLTLIHLTASVFYLIQAAANLVLIILVAVGYKTKLCALVLVFWLTGMNFYYNHFWTAYHDETLWDFLKYDFFQTWSVIGGLLLIVAYGPGGVSVDDYKKKW